METSIVGYRFCPTDEELINYYLKNKIEGKSWLVDDKIREVSICSHEPASLPALSMIKSKDPVWYFFSPKEYTSPKKNVTKRTTPTGFWKATGRDRNVKGDNKRNGLVIGIKKTFVYHEGKCSNAVRTPWTMHEYHITCLPFADQSTYVICKIFYKGNVGDIPSGSNSSEPSHYLVTNNSNTVGPSNTSPLGDQAGEESLYGFCVNDDNANERARESRSLGLCPIPNTVFIDNNNPSVAQDDDEDLGAFTQVNFDPIESLLSDHQEFITQEKSEEYMLKWSCLI